MIGICLYIPIKEREKTDEVILFLETHKQKVQSFVAQNNWTIGMYAVRLFIINIYC
jgi:hypothetical protein